MDVRAQRRSYWWKSPCDAQTLPFVNSEEKNKHAPPDVSVGLGFWLGEASLNNQILSEPAIWFSDSRSFYILLRFCKRRSKLHTLDFRLYFERKSFNATIRNGKVIDFKCADTFCKKKKSTSLDFATCKTCKRAIILITFKKNISNLVWIIRLYYVLNRK